jgi:hypothetical protein
LAEEVEGKPVGPHRPSEPVGEFMSSCLTQTSHQNFPKPSVWYRNHYRPARSISPPSLPRLYCKSPFAVSSPFSRRFAQVVIFSVKEPPCEDTEQELKERVYRSALCAVDLEQIKHTLWMVRMLRILVKQIPDPICSSLQVNDWKPPRLLKTTSQSQTTTAPLLLLETPPTAPLPLPWINQRLNVPPEPSPHRLPIKGTCCPIVFVDPSRHRDSREKKGRRRRGMPKNKNKLVP